MRQILSIVLIICCTALNLNAQGIFKEKLKSFRGQDVVCPGISHDHFSIVRAPDILRKASSLRSQATPKNSQFIVNYVGFPEEAKAAFQRAVDIWEYLIYSDVPIRVSAHWEALGSGILGSANSSELIMNFEGAKYSYTYYPVALAEKLSGKPLNSDLDDDIYCRFSSSVPWHYGEAETIESGKFDFTTIVLHEIGHGLGFLSTMSVSNQTGNYGRGTPYKSIYDVYIENIEGKNLVDTSAYKRNSAALYGALTGGNLFFEKSVENVRPKLFAPSSYSAGSSISHLDDGSYPSGTTNALMTSTARSREVTHHPGPLALSMFYEMGWKNSSIAHTNLKNYAKNTPITFKANILSDTTLKAGTAKLYYTSSAGNGSVTMANTAGTNEYWATLTFPETVTQVTYYFEVQDNYNNTIVSPGKDGVTSVNYNYSFSIGDDKTGPLVYHEPFSIEEVGNPISFKALVDDDFQDAVSKVELHYQINGGTLQTKEMSKYNSAIHGIENSQGRDDTNLYLLINELPNLKANDAVKYQIVATDKTGNKTILPTEYTSTNASAAPTTSFYDFTATNLIGLRNSYVTDFESAETDFSVIGFNVGQPTGFNSKGLHTSHPYKNGLGLVDPSNSRSHVVEFQRDEIAMLRYAITIGSGKNTIISFDEVVLVEPGEAGSTEFFDYVTVEGNMLDGNGWFPLEAAYDSRANSIWQTLFNSSMTSGTSPNSSYAGNGTLTKRRSIPINTGIFNSYNGEPLLIRFRLHSDQLLNGWGWSIDNLTIQESVPVILSNENEENYGIKIFPNPTTEYADLNMVLSEAQKVHVEIFSIGGGKVYDEFVDSAEKDFNHRVNLKALAAGNYVIKVEESKGAAFKRFVKL